MSSKRFYFCCGIAEVGGFRDYKATVSDARSRIQRGIKEIYKPAYLATTNKHQPKAIKALKLEGFKPIQKFVNHNSGNVVTIWLKVR